MSRCPWPKRSIRWRRRWIVPGAIIKQALSAWLEQEDERERLTREALADVDAGRVIDHQAVLAWADSLGTETPLPVPRR